MTQDILSLDEGYSTTRLLTQEKPEIINIPEDKFETVLFLPEGENRKGEGGLRKKGYFKKLFDDKPLVSIITVVFNGEKYLEETIQSVINQTYDNVEYIIVDGGSTDCTLDIIKKYEDKIDYWVSERDKGIYDAMNKGIDVASGEWLNFMNGGDLFYEIDTIKKIFNYNNLKGIDILYGDLSINYGNFKRFLKAKSLKNMWKGMAFSHQSTFIKTQFHKNQKYNLNYNIAADFEFFYDAFYKKKTFKYLEHIVATVSSGGLCDSNRYRTISQYNRIINKKSFSLIYNFYYINLYIDEFLRNIAKKILSKKIVDFIRKKKNHD